MFFLLENYLLFFYACFRLKTIIRVIVVVIPVDYHVIVISLSCNYTYNCSGWLYNCLGRN